MFDVRTSRAATRYVQALTCNSVKLPNPIINNYNPFGTKDSGFVPPIFEGGLKGKKSDTMEVKTVKTTKVTFGVKICQKVPSINLRLLAIF